MSPHRRISLAFAAAAALAVAAPAAASADDVVKVRDACDPATFNAVLGPGACEPAGSRGGSVTFEELFTSLLEGRPHDAWRFSSPITVDEGETVTARFDRGGEFHTFSKVPRFGPGCVGEVNEAMGLHGAPVVDCEAAMSDLSTFVGPAKPVAEAPALAEGRHRFMCLIHPWMKTTVTVR